MTIKRVVITGVGLVTPVGNTATENWDNILNGRSGIGMIEHFDTEGFNSRIGGSIRNFDVTAYIPKKDARKMNIFMHYGMGASCQAIEDSGLEINDENASKIGIAIGSGVGGISTIEQNYQFYLERGPRKVSPFFVPGCIINMVPGHLSIKYGIKGLNYSIVSACSSGTHNIGEATRIIRHGYATAMIAGGAEMGTTPTGLGGFASAKALSTRNHDPEAASRPWDRERDGFVLSDGAGVVMLEEYEHARARGARIYAEVIGVGMNADAYHMTAPSENGEGAGDCMRFALEDAGIEPGQIDYINAHGTSTPAGDLAETMGIKKTFGEHAYKLAVSSTKSMTGHMLGAAGSVEAVYTALSLRDQIAPPTINYEYPDPECDLDYVPNQAREMNMEYAMSNSFGFGGTNGSLVFRRVVD